MWFSRVRLSLARSQASIAAVQRNFASASHQHNKFNVLTKQLRQQIQSKDVVIYEAPSTVHRTFFFMYISAGVQLLFWGNLASLAYVSYGKKESDEEDSPYVLAPKPQRLGIASGLVAVGVGISAAMCLYPWRYINRLSLLKGGNMVRLETCAKGLASHKIKEYPINKLTASQRVFTGVGARGTDAINSTSSYVFLRPQRERMGYILDRKGNYLDPRIIDGLFQR